MAEIEPLEGLHYDQAKTGGLQDVVAPPYDVIDAEQRAELEARSPYNVVRIDLPRGPEPYETAAAQLAAWRADGAIVRDEQPALWVLAQEYTGPDGRARTRRGFLGRVRVEDYGAGRIRPHERTHPGPKEDRLRLTRATEANLSPISRSTPIRRTAPGKPSSRRPKAGRGRERSMTREPSIACGESRIKMRSDRSSAPSAEPSS